MQVAIGQWLDKAGWHFDSPTEPVGAAQLVLYFAGSQALSDGRALQDLRSRFPAAKLVGCSTGGEIFESEVYDDSIAAAALHFNSAAVALRSVALGDCANDSLVAGKRLAGLLPTEGLRAVFVLSDGIHVNGSELVRGLKDNLPPDVILTGGLAGDGSAFKATKVGADGDPVEGAIAAVGFYGDSLDIRHGSFGGWDPFGPERVVTRSEHNILYELDGEPALDLYKRYLGDEARNLPSSALLFPLKIRSLTDSRTDLVRTVVGIDDAAKAMIFAGDIPTGVSAQLMRGDFSHLINGAGRAARQAHGNGSASLAILVSCIGRKLLLGQRVAEEVDAVSDILGSQCRTIGFYSYGEISPHDFTSSCELHNQTMTITVFSES